MRVRVGRHPQLHCPDAVASAATSLPGLVRQLESDLGLAPVLEHPAEHVVAYRGCLAECDSPDRFYHRSFSVDPINVARTLLDWRSQWYEAGWTGQGWSGGTASGPLSRDRLRDLADVERFARDVVPLCLGQRVQRILARLRERRCQIEQIELTSAFDEFPRVWQQLFSTLGYIELAGVELEPAAPADCDLGKLQRALIAPAVEAEHVPLQLTGDGSLIVLSSCSRDVTARAVAELLLDSDVRARSVVVAERDGIIVDNAFERSGLPRAGFQHYSRYRAVAQTLKLSLGLLWRPVGAKELLQFLLHPLGPVPRRIRNALADAVASEPGLGGTEWRRTVARLTDADTVGAQAAEDARRVIQEWFGGDGFAVEPGAPISAIKMIASRCAGWLGARLTSLDAPGERSLFAHALAQCGALTAALDRLHAQGRDRLDRLELDRLLDEVTRDQPDPTHFAERGHVPATSDPGALTEAAETVVWWDLADAERTLRYPWSHAELATLRANGVHIPPMEAVLARRERDDLRAVLAAERRLVLAVHPSDEGAHPLWSRIRHAVRGWVDVDLDSALLRGGSALQDSLNIERRALSPKPLPTPRRWWRTGVPVPARPRESYSSLEKLIHYPYQWVLRYPAALRSGRAEDLADHGRLYGNLAHRLFERFFADAAWRERSDAEVRVWAAANVADLVRHEGAVLLEPGRGIDYRAFATTLERAITALLEHLRSARVRNVVAERPLTATMQPGVALEGTIDLLCLTEEGRSIVLDAKWAGQAYRMEEVAQETQLQLATYAYLASHGSADASTQGTQSVQVPRDWPYQAYFIITTGVVIAPDDAVFPHAIVAGEAAPDPGGLWQRAQQAYQWRRAQMASGAIECNVVGTQADERSVAPEAALAPSADPARFDDFANLTGWDPYA